MAPLGLHLGALGHHFGAIWLHPCPPGGLWPHKFKIRVHVGSQKPPKWSPKVTKNNNKKTPKKTSNKTLKNISQKLPRSIKKHGLSEAFSNQKALCTQRALTCWNLSISHGIMRFTEVSQGKEIQKQTSGTRFFQRSKKHRKSKPKNTKQGLKKTPKVSLKASKNTLKNNLEKTSKKHQKMTP